MTRTNWHYAEAVICTVMWLVAFGMFLAGTGDLGTAVAFFALARIALIDAKAGQ